MLNEAHETLKDENITTKEKYDAAVNLFKALFCRSLFSYPRADHPSFNEYAAMLLWSNHKEYFEDIPDEVVSMLKEKYGVIEGMMTGTFFQPVKVEEYANSARLEQIASYLPYLPESCLDIVEAVIKTGLQSKESNTVT